MSKNSTPIPGLSFSLKRALGISQAKQKIARETGIPTSKAWYRTQNWQRDNKNALGEEMIKHDMVEASSNIEDWQ